MIEEEGLPFPGPEFTSVESGPGPLPEIVENQAIFVSRAQREGIQRVHLAFSAGSWGRASLETSSRICWHFFGATLTPCWHKVHCLCCCVSWASTVRNTMYADPGHLLQKFEVGIIAFGAIALFRESGRNMDAWKWFLRPKHIGDDFAPLLAELQQAFQTPALCHACYLFCRARAYS